MKPTVIRCVAFMILLCAAITAHSPADAAPAKMALVIGNGAYRVGALANPRNDARLMAETLQSLGFSVTLAVDLNYFDFGRTVADFGRALKAAGEDTVGVFFYAGHAIQADGENYLIPVDAELRDALDLSIKTVPMSLVMKGLESAANRLNLIFLDACRNNPFKALTRSTGGGLARMDAPFGTLVSYSTAPGAVALDGRGRNSPYSAALARALRRPGLTVEQALKRVRLNVVEKTNNRQVPWESSSLVGDFYFAGEQAAASAPQTAALSIEPAATSAQHGPNRLPGHEYAGALDFAAVTFTSVYEQDDHTHYQGRLGGLRLDGAPLRIPYFSIFADFAREPKKPANLRMLRLVIQQRFLLDEQSRQQDYAACKPLGFRLSSSGKKTVRLMLYKDDGKLVVDTNYCVLDLMSARDQRFWSGVMKQFGVMLSRTDQETPVAQELISLYDQAVQ